MRVLEFYPMGGKEKRLNLSARDAELLSRMGVQVWYARAPGSAAGEVEVLQSPPQAVETEAVGTKAAVPEKVQAAVPDKQMALQPHEPAVTPELIEFTWVKNDSALLACPLITQGAALQLAQDLLAYAAWRRSPGISPGQRCARGEFRWPQLVDSSGRPERALSAFFDKQFNGKPATVLVDADIATMLEAHLTRFATELALTVQVLPPLSGGLSDPAVKKQIWQNMRAAH